MKKKDRKKEQGVQSGLIKVGDPGPNLGKGWQIYIDGS